MDSNSIYLNPAKANKWHYRWFRLDSENGARKRSGYIRATRDDVRYCKTRFVIDSVNGLVLMKIPQSQYFEKGS
jgi:hypothetical protein